MPCKSRALEAATRTISGFVGPRQSPTKFIVTDEPVTFFNCRAFPSEMTHPYDADLEAVGTRTLFPLGLDSCLIITHIQLVRDPWLKPLTPRVNARFYDPVLKHIGDIQFNRELEEGEVLRINYIFKRRATRYVAAAEEEWLYPERRASIKEWGKLGRCTGGSATWTQTKPTPQTPSFKRSRMRCLPRP